MKTAMEEQVTSREFQTRAGRYLDAAGRHPVFITKHGRTERVVLDVEEYRRLKALDDERAGTETDSMIDAAIEKHRRTLEILSNE